jgi:hypothetical protein
MIIRNSFLSLLISFTSYLIGLFFSISEATCSNCQCKHYDTPNPTYILQFTHISSSNIRKWHSPLQFVKSNIFQTNAVEYTLCNHCFHFLSKDIKSKDVADTYPSFLWNLLVGKHQPTFGASYYYNDVYAGQDLWRMIPSTMCPWWIHSLTETKSDQD